MTVCKFFFDSSRAFNAECCRILNDFNPASKQRKYNTLERLAVNFSVIPFEIFCRSVFWISRFTKCLHAAGSCALSSCSRPKTSEAPLSSYPHWNRLYRELRHLGAESFEMIGVIACSILLLPFDRSNSPRLLRAQVWIENTAEWISGKSKVVHELQEIQTQAKEKKAALVEAIHVIEFTDEEWDEWIETDRPFAKAISSIENIEKRRITRSDEYPFPQKSKTDCDAALSALENLISDRIDSIAIPRQQQLLDLLEQLNPSAAADISLQEESNLMKFQQLCMKIENKINELHELHDPEHLIKNRLDELWEKKIKNDFSTSFAFLVNPHFFLTRKKMIEIRYTYSYRDLENPADFSPETFRSNLLKQIDECEALLEKAKLKYNAGITITLDRHRALQNLGLPESATIQEIKEAFARLCKIHHPDKRGDPYVFDIIKKSRDLLIRELSAA